MRIEGDSSKASLSAGNLPGARLEEFVPRSNLCVTVLNEDKNNHMKPILQHRSTESTLSCYIFYVIVVNTLQLYALNGLLSHNLYQHGVLSMNILDVLRTRIIESFPEITPDELELRVNYAYELIKHIRK